MCKCFLWFTHQDKNAKIKQVVIKTTGVWRHDVTTSRRYDIMSFCDTHWSNVRFIGLFFEKALVEYIGIYADTKNVRECQNIAVLVNLSSEDKLLSVTVAFTTCLCVCVSSHNRCTTCSIPIHYMTIYFFLNDVCQIANLPKLFVMVKRLLNESRNS